MSRQEPLWLRNALDKIAQKISPPPGIIVEKFSTIEDKMNDIKKRIGFEDNSSDKITKESKKIAKTTCNCKGTCNCKEKETVKKILSYIKEVASCEPGISSIEIMKRCENAGVLDPMNTKIDYDKLKRFAENILEKNEKQKEPELKYIQDLNSDMSAYNDMADYYRHGYPTR